MCSVSLVLCFPKRKTKLRHSWSHLEISWCLSFEIRLKAKPRFTGGIAVIMIECLNGRSGNSKNNSFSRIFSFDDGCWLLFRRKKEKMEKKNTTNYNWKKNLSAILWFFTDFFSSCSFCFFFFILVVLKLFLFVVLLFFPIFFSLTGMVFHKEKPAFLYYDLVYVKGAFLYSFVVIHIKNGMEFNLLIQKTIHIRRLPRRREQNKKHDHHKQNTD